MKKTNINEIFSSFSHGVAHRGLHDEMRPENSRSAFENAIENNLPFETDVHLTMDHRLVVNHDHELTRVTGKDGLIEKLTLNEIKNGYRLKDGSQLLEMGELLSLWKERVPLVLEIKEYFGNGEEILKALKPMLDQIKDHSKLVLISFSSNALRLWKDDRWNRGLLIGGGETDKFPTLEEWEFLDVDFTFLEDPHFVSYRENGGKIMAWTIRDEQSLALGKSGSDALTFEIISPAKIA